MAILKIYNSVPDYDSMLKYLNGIYGLSLDNVCLYRNMIGAVYFLWEKDKRYVYKLYRTFDTRAAIHSTQIISYLKLNNFPVVTIIPTKGDCLYSNIEMPEGNRVGVLFEYIDGKEPNTKEDILLIGNLTGKMHRLMENYNGELRELGKEHYIDRFIRIMRDMFSETRRIDEMEKYGKELWNNILGLPKGFCHGDLHTGNLLKTMNGEIIFFDFDISSNSYPILDVATICNGTDFCTLNERDIEKTHLNFEKFYSGYSKEKQLSRIEKSAIYDWIAIRHYELCGTIPLYRLPINGNYWLNDKSFNVDYTWLMQWKDTQKKF